MRLTRHLAGLALAAAATLALAAGAHAQDRKFRIGVITDQSGPLAAGGSSLHGLGARIMIEHFQRNGPIAGYALEAVYADAQSKPEVAINEARRLIEQEKVDMLLGLFSSAQCVPMASRAEQLGTFLYITGCTASAALEGRNLRHVFRVQPSARQFGSASTDMIAAYAREKFGKDARDLTVAIIHEDGAYGVDVALGNEEGVKRNGLKLVVNQAYSAAAPDLSELVAKLRRAQPDVILHTGYNPDIALFLRQARESGLKFGALVGHGAGYGQPAKLREALGADIAGVFNVVPMSVQNANRAAMPADLPPLIALITHAADNARPGASGSPQVGIAASSTYLLLQHVLPRAIRQYGGTNADALRRAALDVDLPEGGTMLGFGVKFLASGVDAGQNERAYPAIVEYTADGAEMVWPKSQQKRPPTLPLPSDHPYAR